MNFLEVIGINEKFQKFQESIDIHLLYKRKRMRNNEMRVVGIDYSLEEYVETHFYRQFVSH